MAERNRTVLVGGGSRGLGAGIVGHFLEQGDRVATFSRRATEAVEEWQSRYPDRFLFRELSLTDAPACRDFLATVEEQLGQVNVLVNNAGLANTSLLALESDDAIDRLIDLNLKGTFTLTRLVCRSMLSGDWGRIINISSIVGLSGYRGLSVYSATKAGLDGFTRSLARELGSRGITVNSVAPGYLTTEMTEELDSAQTKQIIRRTPLGRLGSPADVAKVVRFIASDDADFITGQVIVVDGGITA
jgi:3-oxoacyl-[acyl-carrier protein] reductase